jgi:hypothetical protein
VAAACTAWADAPADAPADAQRLRERHASVAAALAASPFGAPLLVQSGEAGSMAHGDVYALLPHGFLLVDAALMRPPQWCEVLVLHLNVKGCRWSADGVTILLGGKRSAAPSDAYALALAFHAEEEAADYLRVRLDAPRGPVGTRDYVLLFEAVQAAAGETFVHFGYEVRAGFLAQLAMRGYLLTAGRGKIGFSREAGPDGAQRHVGGTRGVMERNAMRYHLAVVAYLDSLALPPPQRRDARLAAWFDATERYPEQLHELERDEYLRMKQAELTN